MLNISIRTKATHSKGHKSSNGGHNDHRRILACPKMGICLFNQQSSRFDVDIQDLSVKQNSLIHWSLKGVTVTLSHADSGVYKNNHDSINHYSIERWLTYFQCWTKRGVDCCVGHQDIQTAKLGNSL